MDDFEIIGGPLCERVVPVASSDTSKVQQQALVPTKLTKSAVQQPSFSSSVIESNRSDGYWVETFHFDKEDKVPGIIASGLVSGLIEFLDNPINAAASANANNKCGHNCKCNHGQAPTPDLSSEWPKYEIGKFDSPVAVVAVDITKNGLMDLVICHDYGPFMLECNPLGGHVTWLENPGRCNLKNGHWKERYIGRWPAVHRVKAGHFTQKSFLEVVAASVVYGQHDKTTPIPIIRFQAPEKVLEAIEWPRDIIDDEHFTCIHEVTPKKCDGEDGLDSLLIASREGTTLLRYKNKQWQRETLTIGEPKEARQSPTSESPGSGDHWGSGCCDFGKVGDDPFAYCATLDPFHGISACVLVKEDRGIDGQKWKRHILDTYGTPNQQLKTGDGPGHYIVCADFDGDGDDEFLLSLFGPLDRDDKGESIPPGGGPHPFKGIMYYKAIDVKNGIFAKWKIADESSARIALGDFGGNGLIDIVSMKYNVKRYYEEPDPVVTLHLNNFASPQKQSSCYGIYPTLWDNEGMVYLSDPATDTTLVESASMPVIEIANYLISVEVYPKKSSIDIPTGEGIKVIYGSIGFYDEKNPFCPYRPKDAPAPTPDETRSPFSVSPFTASATTSTKPTAYASAATGAILLRYTPTDKPSTWSRVRDVPVSTKLDLSTVGMELPSLSFQRVDTTWWGASNPFFKSVDFYNMTGFHLRLLSTKKVIAHTQFWTAGTKVNCGVHNHTDNIFSEVHVCLSAGTDNGGMERLKSSYNDTPPEKLNGLGPEAFDHLTLKPLQEHGGMWERDPYGKAVRGKNNVVKYPWHKWQAGSGKDIDVWMAIEFNPDL